MTRRTGCPPGIDLGLVPIDDALVEVAVPVFNEEAVLEANVTRLCRHLGRHFPFRWQVVIADNASTDGTWAIAARLAAEIPGVRALHLDRKGRGAALRRAWETSEADVVAYMDVDLSTNLESLLPLVSPLVSGHSEVAIGSRLAPRARVRRRPVRQTLSGGYNRLARMLCHTRVSDLQCGFKALRIDAARRLLPRIENDNWFFDTELLLLAEDDGMRIYEVPVDWIEDLDSRVDVPATVREDLAGMWRMRRSLSKSRQARELPAEPPPPGGRRSWRTATPVAAVVGLALAVNLWALDRNDLGNTYYAAAVRSMAQSWHNFFFASFDPGGFITIDKPPLATWVQTAFVKLMGFGSWGLLLPSALAGAGAVLLLYLTVAGVWGRRAGLLAAFVLALTPVSVAVNRSNNPDAILVLLVVAAAWAMQRALTSGRLRQVLLVAVFLALAFNTKTLEAYVVAPALWLAYLVAAPRTLRVRIGHLALAGVTLLGLSAAWVVAVDAVPAGNRPYVGSSTDNSAVELAFGYNGLGRIDGAGEHFGREGSGAPGDGPPAENPFPESFRRMGRRMFGGSPGPGRLFGAGLADQAGWLLPLAAVLGAGAFVVHGRRRDARLGSLVLWGGWLATAAVVFSFAQGIFHAYYLSLMAPGVAALVGIGLVVLSRRLAAWWVRLAATAALGATAFLQWDILKSFSSYAAWLVPLVAAGTLVAATGLVATRHRPALRRVGLAFGAASLLVGPAVWSVTTVGHAADGTMDTAGPAQGGFSLRRLLGGIADERRLAGFLEANRGGAKYLVATTNALSGAPLILATGEPVMAMGGFRGSDPALTPASLSDMIARREVRYFLIGGDFGGFGGRPVLGDAVAGACTPVDDKAWGGSSRPGGRSPLHLYDCSGSGPAVAALAGHRSTDHQAISVPGPRG